MYAKRREELEKKNKKEQKRKEKREMFRDKIMLLSAKTAERSQKSVEKFVHA